MWFLDSGQAVNLDSRKTKNGYFFKLDNSLGATSDLSKLEKCVAISTAEDELNAVAETGKLRKPFEGSDLSC